MSPKKRQKNAKPSTVSNNQEINTSMLQILEETHIKDEYEHFKEDNSIMEDHSIMQEQDEEYELSVIMDIIRMQEKDDCERAEKEKQYKIEQGKKLKLAIEKRDYNIKEILRKLKVLLHTQGTFEKTLVSILETAMHTEDLYIIINDSNLYIQIRSYIGLDGNRGYIRLSDEVKNYVNDMFILASDLTK